MVLLVLTLLLSFTGYLLPWDQLAMWAITVGSNMARATPFLGYEGPGAQFLSLGGVPLVHAGDDARYALLGGTFVGASALLRFYVLHCIAVPVMAMVLSPPVIVSSEARVASRGAITSKRSATPLSSRIGRT